MTLPHRRTLSLVAAVALAAALTSCSSVSSQTRRVADAGHAPTPMTGDIGGATAKAQPSAAPRTAKASAPTSPQPPGSAPSAPPASPTPASGSQPGPAAGGVAATAGAEAPGAGHSPAVVTAEGVAPRSIPLVQVLHAMAVTTTSSRPGIPQAQVPQIAAQIQRQLHSQLDELALASPPAASPAAALQAALLAYLPLADQEAAWNPKGPALPTSFFTSLRAADAQWKAAMEQVGTLSGTDLLAKLPPLAMPK